MEAYIAELQKLLDDNNISYPPTENTVEYMELLEGLLAQNNISIPEEIQNNRPGHPGGDEENETG